MLISVSIFLIFYWKDKSSIEIPCAQKSFFFIPGVAVPSTSLFLGLTGFVLMLAALTVEDWISFYQFKGSLARCDNCDAVNWLGWQCLKGTQCEVNPGSSSCKDYKNYYYAEKSFISLQAVCLVFMTLYLQTVTAFIRGYEYGYSAANYVRII
jgi:hypothetical protein